MYRYQMFANMQDFGSATR